MGGSQKNGARVVNNSNYSTLEARVKNYPVKSFGRVAVLMGGVAAEREVSLRSGRQVFAALKSKQVDVTLIDVTSVKQLIDLQGKFERIFNVIHGRWGEDGAVQAVLDAISMPYTGSDMASSALAMDKLRSKWLWQGAGLSTPEFIMVSELNPFSKDSYTMGFPVIVKPVREGSSIGMRKVDTFAELEQAIEFAKQYDFEVLVEKWIEGREFTCSIIDGIALPLIELKTSNIFYDFDAKYKSNATKYIYPVDLDLDLEKKIKDLSLHAFNIIGASDWGRVDLMLDENNQPWLIELNTVPGMTDQSLVPMAAELIGISFASLTLLLVGLTLV